MGSTAADYLGGLGAGRRPDLPETTSGTVRLDVQEDGRTDHWYLTVADQHVRVSRSADDADLVVRGGREAFDELADGTSHVSAALMRNDLSVQGDIRLLPMLRRIFPGPANARHPRTVARQYLAGGTAEAGAGGRGGR